MSRDCWCHTLIFLLLCLGRVAADFQEESWSWSYIYHQEHSLLLVIVEEQKKCYFIPVDDSAKGIFNTCHMTYLEQEVRDTIEFAVPDQVKQTTLEAMRDAHHDLLADFRCLDKEVFEITVNFGDDYIQTCSPNASPVG